MLIAAACGKKEEQEMPVPAAAAFPVQTITLQDAAVFQEYTANQEGYQNVEIRPKVDGFIQKTDLGKGPLIRKGQLLF
ncbi:hypothetical protein [Flavobacterium fryxellicola]|uniref:Efflux transporter periplasmic adaptor subunit n=1 Tax=Flavobacterium fryxellicola TaxID=249352 RepID=A0A162P8R8_9FLAO|nr:hypothetical protein [Flavobacterium fryxellicola]OAB29470.1 hypothetical protein FBFR_04145 [Flavobacterium fryxellicola]